jgi:hypothetical protein
VEEGFIDGAEQFLAGDGEGFAVVGDIDFEQAAAALACGWRPAFRAWLRWPWPARVAAVPAFTC